MKTREEMEAYDEGFRNGIKSCLVYMNVAFGTNFDDFTKLTNFLVKHGCIAIPGRD